MRDGARPCTGLFSCIPLPLLRLPLRTFVIALQPFSRTRELLQRPVFVYWSEALGVTPDRLRVVVGKVGPMAGKVREALHS